MLNFIGGAIAHGKEPHGTVDEAVNTLRMDFWSEVIKDKSNEDVQDSQTGDFQTRSESNSGGVDGAHKILRRLKTASACGHGVDPVAGLVLNDGEVVVIVVTVVAFVACGKEVKSVAIGLNHGYGHFLNIDSMGVETAEQ